MTTVETRVVDPVARRSSVNPVEVSETQMVEDALQHEEEEKMLEDEEIDSCEGEDLDEQILNAALVKSVVDSGVQPPQSPSSARYGLRRRRRPGDAVGDFDSSPTLKPQVPAETSSSGRTATITNGRLSLVGPTVVTTLGGQQVKKASTGGGGMHGSGGVDTGGGGTTDGLVTMESGERGSGTSGSLRGQSSTVQVKREHHDSSGPTASRLSKPEAVPSTVNVSSRAQSRYQNVASSRESEVPLLVRVDQATQGARVKVEDTNSNLHSVPRLQPEQAAVEKKVTISEPPASFQRNRIFSVDLDPGTFDFSDMAGDPTDMTRGDPDMPDLAGPGPDDEGGDDLAIFKRDRAFSFEFFNFAGDDLLPAPPAAAPAPLPELPEAPMSEDVVSSRPRGESIIFDPTSFQDGGIHEKSAMLVTAAKKPEPPSSVVSSTVSRPVVPTPQVVAPPPPPSAAVVPRSYPTPDVPMSTGVSGGGVSASIVSTSILDNGPVATLPSGLAMGNNANGNTPPTFQMELLNKDGRIGIYLPEDRRARIARFHAKRKMRIWRKRIKYDCRKKLADSRPRIKGRFVKRSDMDDEV